MRRAPILTEVTASNNGLFGCRLLVAIVLAGQSLLAQTSASGTTEQTNSSWTSVTETQTKDLGATRITETHTQNGNRILDKQLTENRTENERFVPFVEVERETLLVDAATVRITTKTYSQVGDGPRALTQVMQEEKHTSPAGNSKTTRVISNLDVNRKLVPAERDIIETKSVGTDTAETNTTVMLTSINGGLAPAMQTHEVRNRTASDTVESEKTVMLLDGGGKWQVDEVRRATTKQEGNTQRTEERVSRRDFEGNLAEVSRVVSTESAAGPEEKSKTVETYSIDVLGRTRDGNLHLVERATSKQRLSANGEQANETKVEQLNPGAPSDGLRLSIVSSESDHTGPSSQTATRTMRQRDLNGSFGIISIQTTNSDRAGDQPQQTNSENANKESAH